METYCTDPDCSPEHPCATCTTVPVRTETMAEVVYGKGGAYGREHVQCWCGVSLHASHSHSAEQLRGRRNAVGAIPAVEIEDDSDAPTDVPCEQCDEYGHDLDEGLCPGCAEKELAKEEARASEPLDLRDCTGDDWAARTP